MYFCGRGCFVAVDGTQPCRRPLRVLGAFWIPVPRSALLCFGGRGGRGAPMMSAAFAGAWSILDPRAQVSPPMLWWARGISRRKLLILLYFDLLVVACVNRWPTLLERRCGCHPSD